MHLSVVVPCFNEEGNIADVVREAAAVGRSLASQLEIVVVDDGSTDGTPEVLHRLGDAVPELAMVRHEVNRGYGAAVRTGLAQASHEYVFLTDGDGQFDLRDLPRAAALLRSHDVVAGYRRSRSDGRWRALWGRSWTGLVNAAFGLQIRDVNCAFKLVPQRLLRSATLSSDGALISAELLYQARRSRMRIAQVPVSHLPRRSGTQSGASLRVILLAFVEFAALMAQRGAHRWSPPSRTSYSD
ncbi:MAG: glycosyltransferase family 2 protein [Polyangiales bacterium]